MAVLECKDLTKHYGAAPALDHVDLAVEPGRIVGLLGPQRQRQDHPHQAGQRPADPQRRRGAGVRRRPGEGDPRRRQLPAGADGHPTWMSVKQLMDFYGDFYADFRGTRRRRCWPT